MISANDLRNVQLHREENGYSADEVNAVIDQAADTIEAYANENKELYRKLEVLAAKIEEYRREEDSIKTALITAQKMADKIEQESREAAEKLSAESEAKAKAVTDEASLNAEKTVSEARAFASDLIKTKTEEANSIVADAEKKANEAINSSKIVAQDILDQAKGISSDLISASKEEKEAYELLNVALRKDANEFIDKLKALYTEQLEALNSAKLEKDSSDEKEVKEIQNEVSSLLNEIDEMEEAIPEEITIQEEKAPEAEEAPADEADSEAVEEDLPVASEEELRNLFDIIKEDEKKAQQEQSEPEEEPAAEEEPADPIAAVEAFSEDRLTPIENENAVPEITEEAEMEEKSLFDGEEQPFESYFKVSKKDAHLDKTQTISLVPPEDYEGEEDDDEPKHKGFFKRKK